MNYTKKELGEALKRELKKGYNIERISNWADDLYISIRHIRTPEIADILRHVFIMGAGPEFEYTHEELMLLADLLIQEETAVIEKVNASRSRKLVNELLIINNALNEVCNGFRVDDFEGKIGAPISARMGVSRKEALQFVDNITKLIEKSK